MAEAKLVHELDHQTRSLAVAAFTAAHGSAPNFGFAPDRAWIEGYCFAAPAQAQEDARVYTYKNQPYDNVTAWRFGEACANAKPGGDLIDHGLSLLQQLEAKGYGIVAINAAKSAGAAI